MPTEYGTMFPLKSDSEYIKSHYTGAKTDLLQYGMQSMLKC